MMLQKKAQWSAALAGIFVMTSAGFASADRFSSWEEMEATGCYEEGFEYSGPYDYNILAYDSGSFCSGGTCYGQVYDPNLVIAIHGGEVEELTDILAHEVWALNPIIKLGKIIHKAKLYLLDVHVQAGVCEPADGGESFNKSHDDLHITAVNYNEPIAEDMVANAYSVVSIHGLKNSSYTYSDKNVVCVGGKNKNMRDDFIRLVNGEPLLDGILRAEDATLPQCQNNEPPVGCTYCPTDARGIASGNIVNRSANPNGGLQLEFTLKARQDLYKEENYESRRELIKIIQDVMFLETTGLN